MANPLSPGGGYTQGNTAQEEELCPQCLGLYEELRSARERQVGPIDFDTEWDYGYPLTAGPVLVTEGVHYIEMKSTFPLPRHRPSTY